MIKKYKIIFSSIILLLIGISTAFAINNYIKKGFNWDANRDTSLSPNDIFTLSGRLDIEASDTDKYLNQNYRGKITGTVNSQLFGDFNIVGVGLDLINDNSKSNCTDSTETFSLSGTLKSSSWGDMEIKNTSYFCANGYTVLKLKSNLLGDKNIGDSSQSVFGNIFGKQQISITGIGNLKGTGSILTNQINDGILKLSVENSTKTIAKSIINKNISKIMKDFYNSDYNISKNIPNNNLIKNTDFINPNKENYYLYKYSQNNSDLDFSKGTGGKYSNKGEILQLGVDNSNHIKVSGKQSIIVEGGNIYIKANTYNENKNSLLMLIAKKDKDGNGGNIYIDTDVTNIDAVLFSDGSLISMTTNNIQEIDSYKNNLRKQLLIYGSVFSSNNVGTDKIPYGADYYEKLPNNELEKSIYDLGNLRTFNLNYGTGSTCSDETKLAAIDGNGDFKTYAWAGKCKCYSGEECDSNLRKSTKNNPLIIEYNSSIQLLNSYLLQKN